MSTTDQALLSRVQYLVLEPADGGVTFPSGLWTQAEVLAYLSERQNRLIKATPLLVGLSAPIPLAPGVFRFALPDDWIQTDGVLWTGSDGTQRVLTHSDAFEIDHAQAAWTNTRGTPQVYLDYEAPTLQMQIAPAPDVSGTVQLSYTAAGAPLSGAGTDTLVVPDEFAIPVTAYGVAAEMWSKDGRGKNLTLAAYAEQRYQLGIELAQLILGGWV